MTLNGTTTRPASGPSMARPSLAPHSNRRRSWVLAGMALVIGFTLVFATASLRLGGRQSVLAVARSVPPGHVLGAADLTQVRVAVDGGLRVVPASERRSVLGRPAAVALVAGSLLSPDQLGASSALPPGQAVVGVALKAGQFPSALAAGARVRVLDTGSGASIASWAAVGVPAASSATVVDVQASDMTDASVVSLQLAAADADRVAVAASAGRVALVQLAAQS